MWSGPWCCRGLSRDHRTSNGTEGTAGILTRDGSRIAWILFLELFSFFAVVLLLGPNVPDDQQAHYCVINLKGPGPFGLSLNCDSIEFLWLSGAPSRLLDKNNV